MKSKLFFALLVLLTWSACKNITTSTDIRLKRTISFMRTDTSSFDYTPDGKISQRHGFSNAMWQVYQYDNNRVLEEGDGPQPGHGYKTTYYLNSKGLADSSVRSENGNSICIEYKYDENGYRIEEYTGCDTKELARKRIFENGNMVQDILYAKGNPVQVGYYDYYTDKVNMPTAYGEEKLGYTFRGKDSKNLMKKMVLLTDHADTLFMNTFSYYFDDIGRVSILAITAKTGEPVDSLQYYYY